MLLVDSVAIVDDDVSGTMCFVDMLVDLVVILLLNHGGSWGDRIRDKRVF